MKVHPIICVNDCEVTAVCPIGHVIARLSLSAWVGSWLQAISDNPSGQLDCLVCHQKAAAVNNPSGQSQAKMD